MHSITELLEEFDRSQAYTLTLWSDLDESQVHWRADENASGIGWHLGQLDLEISLFTRAGAEQHRHADQHRSHRAQ